MCTLDWQASKLSDTNERSGEMGTVILVQRPLVTLPKCAESIQALFSKVQLFYN